MRKRIVSLMTVIVLAFSVCIVSTANETDKLVQRQGTAAELKSYGAIVYQKNGEGGVNQLGLILRIYI